jgi:hypothetical protein
MRIRIGKDIEIRWSILTDGSAARLRPAELTLELLCPNGKAEEMEFTAKGNTLTATYPGMAQRYTGTYGIVLWKNKGKEGQSVVDKAEAFTLVARTHQESLVQEDDLAEVMLDLGTSSLATIAGASVSAIVSNLTGYKALASVEDLPAEETTLGYLIGTRLYVYVGEGGNAAEGMYQDCGEFRGPQGEQGEQGIQGPQGNSGYQGAKGELEVVNNLTQGGEKSALSAEMGKKLYNMRIIAVTQEELDNLTDPVEGAFYATFED